MHVCFIILKSVFPREWSLNIWHVMAQHNILLYLFSVSSIKWKTGQWPISMGTLETQLVEHTYKKKLSIFWMSPFWAQQFIDSSCRRRQLRNLPNVRQKFYIRVICTLFINARCTEVNCSEYSFYCIGFTLVHFY